MLRFLFKEEVPPLMKGLAYLFIPLLCIMVYCYYYGLFGTWISYFLGQSEVLDFIRHLINPLIVLSLLYVYLAVVISVVFIDRGATRKTRSVYIIFSFGVFAFFYHYFVDKFFVWHLLVAAIWLFPAFLVDVHRLNIKRKITICLICSYLICCFFSYQIGVHRRNVALGKGGNLVMLRDNNERVWKELEIKSAELKYFIHLGGNSFFLTENNAVQMINDALLKNVVMTKKKAQ